MCDKSVKKSKAGKTEGEDNLERLSDQVIFDRIHE